MARVVDLTETEKRPEILTSTSVSGRLLGEGRLVASAPLSSYLGGDEQPQYVARNKTAGVEVVRDGETEQVPPDEGLQALALVTDLRVLFVIGKESGDERFEIALADIVEAKTHSERFRTTTLVVNTVTDEQWRFACRGDLGAFAATVDKSAGLWAQAQRLLDDAEHQVRGAELALREPAVENAREELGDAEEKLQRARTQIRAVGPAATDRIDARAEPISDRLVEVTRELTAAEGAQAHAQGQTRWKKQAYEAAVQAYEKAIEAYREALSTPGETPTDDTLRRRLRGATAERTLLRVAPVVDCDTDRRRAIAEDDPELAATWWNRALDGYRELLTLDWGAQTREFEIDRDAVREQTVQIADRAVDEHLRAGRQWLISGDRLAGEGYDDQARRVYERAREAFEDARQLATEVRPERLTDIESALDRVESRESGAVPDEPAGQTTPETVEITGFEYDEDSPELTDGENSAGAPAPQQGANPADERTEHCEQSPGSCQGESTASVNSGGTPPDEIASPAVENADEPEATSETEGEGTRLIDSFASDESERARPANTQKTTKAPETAEEVASAITDLTPEQFDTLVAELWESQGWSTTTFSVDVASAFDIIAVRETPRKRRLGIWTIHRPGQPVSAERIERYRDADKAGQEAKSATVVTTGRVTEEARNAAASGGFSVVDTEELVSLVRFENMTARLGQFS